VNKLLKNVDGPTQMSRPYSRSEVLDFIGSCADKRTDLPGNYFVPFV
jgi:hypothetical protein